MKKLILNAVSVLVIVIILDFTIGKILRHFYFTEISGPNYRTTYAMDYNKADVLVFGPSVAMYDYAPKIFEDSLKMSFYSTGGHSLPIICSEMILKASLKRYMPKVIILTIGGGDDFETWKKNTDPSYDRMSLLLPYCKEHNEIRGIMDLKSPYERFKLLSGIYPFNSQILPIIMGNFNEIEMRKKQRPEYDGCVSLNGIWKDKVDTQRVEYGHLDSVKINFYKDFISMAKNSGAKVFVIVPPKFYMYTKNEEIDICGDICSIENVPFWNYTNDTSFINHAYLYDEPIHLNTKGTIIFSAMIAHRMKNYFNKDSI